MFCCYGADVVFVPEANNGQKIRSLKSLFLNASGVVVHGDSVEQCTVYNVQCTVDAAVRKVSAGPRSTLRTNHSQRTVSCQSYILPFIFLHIALIITSLSLFLYLFLYAVFDYNRLWHLIFMPTSCYFMIFLYKIN